MYANCPKCGHAPLPTDQAAPAACPACGVILAKFGTAPARAGARAAPAGRSTASQEFEEAPSLSARGAALLLYVPREVSALYWKGRLGALAVFVLWTLLIFKNLDMAEGVGNGFLHLILIPFHEAGHVFLFWAPSILHYFGGALGQAAMPLILAGSLLLKRRDPFGAALFTWLLGFSLIDTAIYMYDAYDPHLMLLTGHTGAESANHDWIQVFGDLGLLNHARGIGRACAALGGAVMVAALAWAGLLLWKQRERLSENPLAEENL